MTDHPIIFSAPMIQALLDGRKTMTRRLAYSEGPAKTIKGRKMTAFRRASPWQRVKPGDRLWMRESLTRSGGYIQYAADARVIAWEGGDPPSRCWPNNWKQDPRPSIHMPRWASRLTLVVTATKIERVQEISEEDAIAEGIVEISRSLTKHGRMDGYGIAGTDPADAHAKARSAFAALWDELRGPGSWDANPEVVAITFSVHQCNIDSMPEAS